MNHISKERKENMMRKKLVGMLLCAAMVTGLVTGCGNSEGNDADGKGSVYWLNLKPEADEALQGIAKTYQDETGVEVKVVTAASGTYDQTLMSELEKSEAPTLFVVGTQVGVKKWGEFCYDLKDTDVYNELTTDAFTLTNDEGTVCSIGYCYESFGLIVNKKLLGEAGYEITDIKNFDSLKSVAEDIHSRADELGFDAFTSSGMDDSSSWRFTGHLANMPIYYESLEDGWTETPATIKGTYLENYKNVWDLYIENSAVDKNTLATGGYDAEAEFMNEEAVFYQNGTWEYAALSEAIADEDMQMIPIYCGVEGEENAGLCSGTENRWAVNKNASEEDIQATLDFMKWLVTSEEGTKMMEEQFGAIPYKSAAESTNVFLQNANDLLNEGKYNVDWAFNYTPNVEEWRSGVVAALNQYDAGGSWDDVETAFVDGWATQYIAAYAE